MSDEAINERIRLFGAVCLIVFAVFLPPLLLESIGLEEVPAAIGALPAPLRFLTWIVIWSISFVVLRGVLRGITIFLAHAAMKGAEVSERLTAATSTFLIEGSAIAVSLFAWPFRRGCDLLLGGIRQRLALIRERARQNAELRRMYREEFAGQFASFAAFKAHFYGHGEDRAKKENGQSQRDKPAQPDSFRAACALLGLPDSGAFTAEILKERFRALMKAVHPDIIGESGFARQLNDAYATIKQKKGWK